MKRWDVAIGLVAVLAPCSALAQSERLDPSTVAVPQMRYSPSAGDNGRKYFFYWKAEVSFDRAMADLEECYGYSVRGEEALPFTFDMHRAPKPEPGAPPPPRPTGNGNYGLVGAVIGGLMGSEFVANQHRLRMCMGFKNYTRFALPKPMFEEVMSGGIERAIIIWAKIASGPRPEAEELLP